MNKLIFTLGIALAIFGSQAFGQANVQIIHNSGDVAARTVDVYLNGAILLDDFEYRTATPYVPVPSGVDLDVVIQPSTSVDTAGALFRKVFNVPPGDYTIIADGVLQTSYAPFVPFDLIAGPGQATPTGAGFVDVLIHHGSTDAPTVDVTETVASLTLADDLAYGTSQGYLALPTADYTVGVETPDQSVLVAEYAAPLATLGLDGSSLVAIASGFVAPGNNSGGDRFGIFAILSTGGEFVPLPTTCAGDDPTLSVNSTGTTTADLSWTDENQVYRFVYQATGGAATEMFAIAPAMSLTGLTPCTFHRARVYSQCVSQGNGGVSNTVKFTTTGCRLGQTASILETHPNPASDYVVVNYLPTGDNDVVFQMYDISGKLFAEQFVGTTENMAVSFDVSNLSSGLYIVNIIDGDYVETQKLMVK